MPQRLSVAEYRRIPLIIETVLTTKNLKDAGKMLKLTGQQLSRWLRKPEVQRMIREAHDAMFAESLHRLRGLTGRAVSTLGDCLDCGDARTKLEASKLIISYSLRLHEFFDFAERLERLEQVASAGGDQPLAETGARLLALSE